MSRAHPIGLRIASKKLSPSYIGIGQYCSYNQLKYNIFISKSIQQLNKQLAVPTYQIVDHFNSEKKNTKNLILYPNILPVSVRLKAKQLFDSQYVLNRRRLYSMAIYITRLLRQQFEKNYNNFRENTYAKSVSNDTKHRPSALGLPVASFSKYQKWKSARIKYYSLCPSITFVRALFRVPQKPFFDLPLVLTPSVRGKDYDIKGNQKTQNQKTYRKEKKVKLLQQTKQGKILNVPLPIKDSDPYLMLSYGIPFFGNYSHVTWQKYLSPKLKALTPSIRGKDSIMVKTKVKNTLKVKKQGKHTSLKAKNKDQTPLFQKDSPVFFPKNLLGHWALRGLYSKPGINHQIIKRFILLNYLCQLSPANSTLYEALKLKKNHEPTLGTPLALAKEVGNKQKRLYINSVPINKEEVFTNLPTYKVSYTFCPRSSLASLNLKSIKKLTKQIEHFRSDIKLLAPLGLLLHRSFSGPIGINCISAIDNRFGKMYCNPFLKNFLFRRTSDNFLKSGYMASQTGLLRAKNTILFDFGYTKDSLIKLGLKKTNTLMQQLLETGHTKLWLRKLSSVRL